MGIIERWTLPLPEIRIPSYRTARVGAWELKRQRQPVLRGYFLGGSPDLRTGAND